MSLSFEQFQETNAHRCETAFHKVHDLTPTEWIMNAFGELGEAANKIKKLRLMELIDPENNHAQKREELIKEIGGELADTITYIDLLFTRLGESTEHHVSVKFNEVSDRRGCDIKLPVREIHD